MGKDKIFKAGILIFIAGSAICFLSGNYYVLLAGRVVEGVGSAAS